MEIKRIFLISAGFIMLGVGAIGIVLPVLPTTPFVLVSAACFSSGSPKLEQWLIRTKYFGQFIKNYKTKCGVPKKVKVRALAFLWCMLGVSAFIIQKPVLWLVLSIVGICVSLHILFIKNKEDELH